MAGPRKKIQIAMRQFQGNRERQEDTIEYRRLTSRTNSQAVLMVLADGVGGEAGGQVASRLAVNVFCDVMSEPEFGQADDGLLQALKLSNQAVAHAARTDPELENMGCTLLAVLVGSGALRWISVGDSILYRLRGGTITQINEDHSIAGLKKINHPLLDGLPEAVKKRGNALVSVVAGFEFPMVDCSERIELEDGDVLLAASDGILTLEEPAIMELCDLSLSATEIAGAIMGAIETRNVKKQDNVSLSVIKAVALDTA